MCPHCTRRRRSNTQRKRDADHVRQEDLCASASAKSISFSMSTSQDSSKEELWEARVDASSGARFFVHRLTKAVRYSPPSHSAPEVSQSPCIRFAGSVDAFRKQLVIIASSPSIAPDAKVKQCGHVLSDAWALLSADAGADQAANPVLYVGILMDIYESTCISASAMLGEDTIIASCLSFLVKAQHGATLLLQTIGFSFHADTSLPHLLAAPPYNRICDQESSGGKRPCYSHCPDIDAYVPASCSAQSSFVASHHWNRNSQNYLQLAYAGMSDRCQHIVHPSTSAYHASIRR